MRCLLRVCASLILAGLIARAQLQASTPLVVPATGRWDGIDGPWSTFNLGVGDPVQLFRCVPALSLPVVLLPISSQRCNANSSGACAARSTFQSRNSKTYKMAGVFYAFFGDFVSLLSNATAREGATWGQDNVYFGNDAFRGVGSAAQYVVGVESLDFFVGTFGLAIGAVSPTGATRPTLLSALFEAGVAPSYSVSYTAGSANTNSTGSLILGGYDTARFDARTTKSFLMPNKQNNTLLVYLLDISVTGPNPRTLSTKMGTSGPGSGSYSFRIDSVVPQLWLPVEACMMFESAFGLTWDYDLALYTLNDSEHTRMLQENPTVSFTLGTNAGGSVSQKYTLPYSAFDLRLDPPLVNKTTYYFPLKRAQDASQYVLGRTFLQETYITVDYERANFSLSQAYPAGGPGYIVPILNMTYTPGNSTGGTTSNGNNAGSSKKGVSTGASAGIGVGVGVLALAGIGLVLSWRKGWLFFRKTSATPEKFEKGELHGNDKPRVEAMEKERAELAGTATAEAMGKEAAELETVETSQEAGILSPRVEGVDEIHELDGDPGRSSESSPDQEGMSKGAVLEPRT